MSDPFIAYKSQPCACRFTMAADFGIAKPVDICGFHSAKRAETERLRSALWDLRVKHAPIQGFGKTLCATCKKEWPSAQESWACLQSHPGIETK